MTSIKLLASLAPAILMAGCAASGDYPSLAQRPAERETGTFTPDTAEAAPLPPPPISADVAARLASLQRDAEAAHAEFNRAAPAAERAAGGAGAVGSDGWAAAQVALADLDSLRSRAAVALAEIDLLWIDATVDGGPQSAIAPVRDRIESLIAAEDAVLARLRARVG